MMASRFMKYLMRNARHCTNSSKSMLRVCFKRVSSASSTNLTGIMSNILGEFEVTSSGKRAVGSQQPWVSEEQVTQFCQQYQKLSVKEKSEVLLFLSKRCGVNHADAVSAASALIAAKDEPAIFTYEHRLQQSLSPQYTHLFTMISRTAYGVKFLVDMRSNILDLLSTSLNPNEVEPIRHLNASLRGLLVHWFSTGLLNLQRITWQSSCDMLQKVSEYEAVHPVQNWLDLKRRVGAYRRCFVFTHNSMPLEPVVVLHTALTQDISTNIQSLVKQTEGVLPSVDSEDISKINAAIFYSVTSTQRGLQGIDLGNYLIKTAVQKLRAEFPNMNIFSSLSPIPGFRDWLLQEINKQIRGSTEKLFLQDELSVLQQHLASKREDVVAQVKELIHSNSWSESESLTGALKPPLCRLCARYLYEEKHRGYAVNPVANFHLRNGATMWRINWLGDTSSRGLAASCGLMVNYRYFLDKTRANSQAYVEHKHIDASKQVLDILEPLHISRSKL
ncbi:malonyl-CoA decarboxylase, mitochondrial-like [Anneissia japonica]|uniref:malonyl-CoA decarboxylase, mitochondrial-like n=1 Tax=Anneissia japonica TaxID=1529436 RepID=UPI0014258888|nr:malonyl-CoA decarboxylase, mitochondrial-like [Anneissia japonica]